MLERYKGKEAPPSDACLLFQPRTQHVSARLWSGVGRSMSFLRIDARLDALDYVGHGAQELIQRFRASLSSFPIWLNEGDVGEPPRLWARGSLTMGRDKSFVLLNHALGDPQVARLLPFFAAATERLSIIFTGVLIDLTENEAKFALVDFELGTQQSRVG